MNNEDIEQAKKLWNERYPGVSINPLYRMGFDHGIQHVLSQQAKDAHLNTHKEEWITLRERYSEYEKTILVLFSGRVQTAKLYKDGFIIFTDDRHVQIPINELYHVAMWRELPPYPIEI